MSSDVEGRITPGPPLRARPGPGTPGERAATGTALADDPGAAATSDVTTSPAAAATVGAPPAADEPGVTTVSAAPPREMPTAAPTPIAEPEPAQEVPAPSATRRVRARLTRRMSGQRAGAPPNRTVLEPLFAVHRGLHPKADLKLVQRAYEVAEKAHNGQFRKSGDPYITHPLAVATILADLGMDTTTLVAALLHDTVEDTPYTLENATTDFGEEVAHLVDGVTKLDKVYFGDATEAETIRKMIIAMA